MSKQISIKLKAEDEIKDDIVKDIDQYIDNENKISKPNSQVAQKSVDQEIIQIVVQNYEILGMFTVSIIKKIKDKLENNDKLSVSAPNGIEREIDSEEIKNITYSESDEDIEIDVELKN